MTRNVMIDLETLGTSVDTIVLSVGMAFFTEEAMLPDPYYVRMDLDEQIRYGRKPTAGTICWWLNQNKEAQEAVFGQHDKTHVVTVATLYADLRRQIAKPDKVWARGADFDIAILKHMFGQLALNEPWTYSNVRDSRTFLAMFPDLPPIQRDGAAHDALSDATYEAKRVLAGLSEWRYLKRLGAIADKVLHEAAKNSEAVIVSKEFWSEGTQIDGN